MYAKLYQQSLRPSTKSWILEINGQGAFTEKEEADIDYWTKHFSDFHHLNFYRYYDSNMYVLFEITPEVETIILEASMSICEHLNCELKL
jgi:hypothetical protein